MVVRYRHHPYFNSPVEIVRPFGPGQLLVRVRDNVQFVIPEWMFDAASCNATCDAERPCIAASALLALRSLLDHQSLLFSSGGSTGNAVGKPGDQHGQVDDSTSNSAPCDWPWKRPVTK